MRILHPKTIRIIANEDIDFTKSTSSRKLVLSHSWSEMIKFKSQDKPHPKVFITDDFDLGCYMAYIYQENEKVGCKLDSSKLEKFEELFVGFTSCAISRINKYFDDNYLFSDCVSLYFKGVNIFPFVFGDDWRKYVPVESLKEIQRQVNKTLEK